MAIIDTIREFIQDEINRPEKGSIASGGNGEIDRRIAATVIEYHQKELYTRDMIEGEYVFASTENIQQINLSLIPSFRKIAYLRPFVPGLINSAFPSDTGSVEGQYFEEISVDRASDGYGYDKDKTYYISGSNPSVLNLRSLTSFGTIVWGYYKYPTVSPIADLDSWIAIEYPRLIAWDVAQQIATSLGKDAESDRMSKRLAMIHLTFQGNQVLSK